MDLAAERRATWRAATGGGRPMKSQANPDVPPVAQQLTNIAALLRGYADRGVFSGCSEPQVQGARAEFRIVWHYDRLCRFVIDTRACTVSFPDLLPDMSARSPMAKALRAFVVDATSSELPPHRRIDPKLGRIRVSIRNGCAHVAMDVLCGDYEYCARRLVHIAQEVFVVFLRDGPYYDYRIESLGVDPDVEWA